MRYCKNCGLLAPQDADRCPQCGAPLPPLPAQAPAASSGPHYHEPKPTGVPALSEGATLATLLLFSIPIAGFILSLAWSFGFTHNPARRRLAQAWLIRTLIIAVIVTALAIWLALMFAASMSNPYYYYAF